MLTLVQLRDYRPVSGKSTLVSFLIPPTFNLQKLREKVTGEVATAQNIKNRITRQSALTCLNKIGLYLRELKTLPYTGMGLFAEQHI